MVLDYHVLNGDGIVTLITWQDGGPLFRDGKVGTEQDCCCGQQSEFCFEWEITISGGNFGTVTFNGSRSAGECACYEGGEPYEIFGEAVSIDQTKTLTMSGVVNVICVNGECQFDGGSFGFTVRNVADESIVCDGSYHSAADTDAAMTLPYTVEFQQDDNACDDEIGDISITCVVRGPLSDCFP